MIPEKIIGTRISLLRNSIHHAELASEAIDESIQELAPWQPWVEKYQGISSCLAYSNWVEPQWGSRFDFQIFDQEGKFLGQADLENYRPETQQIEVGYWLRTSETGKGYATETVLLLCQAALEHLGIQTVRLSCDPNNEKSRRVAFRSGFSEITPGDFVKNLRAP